MGSIRSIWKQLKHNHQEYCCTPGDYAALDANIKAVKQLNVGEYEEMSARCIEVSQEELNFNKQMGGVVEWMK